MATLRELQDLKQLYTGWHIHHIDWNHSNNSPDNLILVHPKVHEVLHKKGVSERWEVEKLNKMILLSELKTEIEIREILQNDENLQNIDFDTLLEARKRMNSSNEDSDDISSQLDFGF